MALWASSRTITELPLGSAALLPASTSLCFLFAMPPLRHAICDFHVHLCRVPNRFCGSCRKGSGLDVPLSSLHLCAASPAQCRRLSESFKDLRLLVVGFRALLRPPAKFSVLSGGLRLRFRLDWAAELPEQTGDFAHIHSCSLNSA